MITLTLSPAEVASLIEHDEVFVLEMGEHPEHKCPRTFVLEHSAYNLYEVCGYYAHTYSELCEMEII